MNYAVVLEGKDTVYLPVASLKSELRKGVAHPPQNREHKDKPCFNKEPITVILPKTEEAHE